MNRLALAALFLLAPLSLHAASFNCAKARTHIEKTICSSPKLSAEDDQLAQAYHSDLTNYPQAAKLIRQSQRNWLRQIKISCSAVNNRYTLADCLDDEWQNRIRALSQNVVKREGGVVFFFQNARLKLPSDDEGNQRASAASSTQKKSANITSPQSTFQVTWPQVLSNAPQWQAWNKALLDEAYRFYDSSDTRKSPHHWVLRPPAMPGTDVTVEIDLDSVTPAMASADIEVFYTYVHPGLSERSFIWLLKQHRELKPDDLFRANSGWQAWMKKQMSEVVWKHMFPGKSDPDAVADTKSLAKSAGEDAIQPWHWRIRRKGLSIIFSQVELGYLVAVLMPPTTFTWSQLKPYLNPHFQIPR